MSTYKNIYTSPIKDVLALTVRAKHTDTGFYCFCLIYTIFIANARKRNDKMSFKQTNKETLFEA
jgi:hypothetical protein